MAKYDSFAGITAPACLIDPDIAFLDEGRGDGHVYGLNWQSSAGDPLDDLVLTTESGKCVMWGWQQIIISPAPIQGSTYIALIVALSRESLATDCHLLF